MIQMHLKKLQDVEPATGYQLSLSLEERKHKFINQWFQRERERVSWTIHQCCIVQMGVGGQWEIEKRRHSTAFLIAAQCIM